MSYVTKEQVLGDLRRVAKRVKVLSRANYRSLGNYSSATVEARFSTWSNAKKIAGVKN